MYDEKRKKVVKEPSLALVENEDFVYYNKGVINMYKLKQVIGEDKLNKAIRLFIRDWRSYSGIKKTQTDQYATALDLLEYFKIVTPAHQQQVIYDLFETNAEAAL